MSDKPVAERLQVKGMRKLAVIDPPAGLDALVGALQARAPTNEADVVLLFVADKANLASSLAANLPAIATDAIVWIAYPKLTSKLAADLNRDIAHALAPSHGLTTVAQIAIDTDWSALRFKREAVKAYSSSSTPSSSPPRTSRL